MNLRTSEPTRRALPGFDFHAISRPARTFTGDFYVTHPQDGLWIALGDVAGKGLPAAVLMAMIQEELEQRFAGWAAARQDPAEMMRRVDAFLRPLLPANRFATAVIAHLREDGSLVLANGGHCEPLLVRKSGRIERIGSTGPVVGILDEGRWSSLTTRLDEEETLLLYSDGVIEATSSEGEEFGFSSIAAAISGLFASARPDARQIAERILGAVDRHHSGARHDDLTLVVVRRKAAPVAREERFPLPAYRTLAPAGC